MSTAAPRRDSMQARHGLPRWVSVAGGLLVLVFVALVVEAYSGKPTLDRIVALVPSPAVETLTDPYGGVVWYLPGDTVTAGQRSIGERGQDHALQAGDLVLLGASHRLVRLTPGKSPREVQATEGTTVAIGGLGGWDEAGGRMTGLAARYVGGAWMVDAPGAQRVGANLLDPRVPEEELPVGFAVVPENGGRVRRSATTSGPVVRLRPNNRLGLLGIEGWQPLIGLGNVPVTVRATVRAAEGATVELVLTDVVDAAGTVQTTSDRREIEREDAWQTLRVQRRVLFPSERDRYTIRLVDVRNRDWLEIAAFEVYLGGQP